MRLRASLWAIAGIVWLASAAAIPRLDDAASSTCSSTAEQSPAIVTDSSPTPVVLTLTITPDASGSSFGSSLPGSVSASSGFPSSPSVQGSVSSSSCTSSETAPWFIQGTAGVSGPLTVTVTELHDSSSALPIPVVTVTISAVSTADETDEGALGSVSAVSAPSASGFLESTLTITVPESSGSGVDSVLTVTIQTWPPAAPATTETPTSAAVGGAASTPISWSSASTEMFTIPVSFSGQTTRPNFSSSDPFAPFTVTYTLSPEPGLPTPFTGTITVTPLLVPLPSSMVELSNTSDSWEPITITVSDFPTPSAIVSLESFSSLLGLSSSTCTSSVAATHTANPSISSDEQTGVITVTVAASASASTSLADQPDIVTVTETIDVSAFPTSSSLALSEGTQPSILTITVSETSGTSADEGPFGSGVENLSGTITITVPAVTTTASNLPHQETLTGSGSIFSSDTSVSGFANDGYASVVTVAESIITVTLSSMSGSSESSNSHYTPEVVTITEPAFTFTATPSSPVSSWSKPYSSPEASIIAVTYTVPRVSGAEESSYTVTYTLQPSTAGYDEYGTNSGPSWSAIAPEQTSQRSTVETVTVGEPSDSSNDREPVTLTLTPSDELGAPITVTYAPDGTGIVGSSAIDATGSSSASIVTVTIPAWASITSMPPADPEYSGVMGPLPDEDSSAPLISQSTATLKRESSTGSSSFITFTLPSGSPIVVTIPDDGGSVTTVAGQPSVVTVTEGISTPCESSVEFSSSTTSASTAFNTTAGALPASSSNTSSPSGVLLTVTPESGSPVVVTVSNLSDSITVSSIQPTVVTVTEELPSTSTVDGNLSGTLPTITPVSGSPVVVTIPGSEYEGGGRTTVSSDLPYGISDIPSVAVSTVTFSQTVSIAFGSSTVIEFTTQFPVPASSSSPTASVSTVITPVVATFTITDGYGHDSTVLTYTSNLPVQTSLASSGALTTGSTFSSPVAGLNSADGLVTSTLSSSSCSQEDSSIALSTASTAAQPENPVPSEVTIWPPPGGVNNSCTTFSTGYRSSSAFSTTSLAPLPVTTSSPVETSSELGGERSSSCSESEATLLPSQFEFQPPAQATTDDVAAASTSTFGGYVFTASDAGYGNPAPQYGNPAQSSTSALSANPISQTDTDLPLSQSATASVTSQGTSSATSVSTIPSLWSSVVEPSGSEPCSDSTASGFTTSAAVSNSTIAAPSSLTSIPISLPSTENTATSTYSTTVALPTISLISSSSEVASSTAEAVPTTEILSSTSPLTTITNSTTVSSPTAVSSDFVSSTKIPINGTVTTSPDVLTATPTDIAPSSVANATSLSTPAIITPPTVVNITSLSIVSISTGLDLNATQITLSVTSSNPLLPSSTAENTTTTLDSIINTVRQTASETSVFTPFLNSTTPPALTISAPSTPVGGTASSPTTPIDSSAPVLTSAASATFVEGVPIVSALDIATATALTESAPSDPPSAPPTAACGAAGDRGVVVFHFDDIPALAVDKEGDLSRVGPQPVPFPYHRFFFSDGFHVVPPPKSKYEPSSGSQMLQHDSFSSPVGHIGLAPLRSNPCFRFALQGLSLGCNSTDEPCIFDITALKWNGAEEVAQGNRTFEISACPESSSCGLSHHPLEGPAFQNLTAINITLASAGQPQTWWADDLQIAWADDDCAAAACRSRVPNTIMIPRRHGMSTRKARGFFAGPPVGRTPVSEVDAQNSDPRRAVLSD